MPPWHMGYLKLKLLKKRQVQRHSDLPPFPWKQEINLPWEGRNPQGIRRVDGILMASHRKFKAEKAV